MTKKQLIKAVKKLVGKFRPSKRNAIKIVSCDNPCRIIDLSKYNHIIAP